jgi:hypothetical protein
LTRFADFFSVNPLANMSTNSTCLAFVCLVVFFLTRPDSAVAQTCPLDGESTPVSCSTTVSATLSDLGEETSSLASYSCGTPSSGLTQSGVDHLYSFQCQSSGNVTIQYASFTCDFDIYVLNDTCSPSTGCLTGDTGSDGSGSLTFACTAGLTYYLVVEARGAAEGGSDECLAGDSYQFAFDAGAGLGCTEDCDDGFDNDENFDTDCDDAACSSDAACVGFGLGCRVLLEGAYTGSGFMTVPTGFRAEIPLSQPFSDAAYDGTPLDYDGSETISAVPDSTVDWVLVSLRELTTGASTVETVPALVHAGGTVTGVDGNELSFPTTPKKPYYVVLRHRNHVAAMSPTSVDFSSGFGSWDSRAGSAYSIGGTPLRALGDGYYGLFAGDANLDGFVTAPDFNAWNASTTSGETGYLSADYSLDSFTTAPDFNLWNANTTAGAASEVPE